MHKFLAILLLIGGTANAASLDEMKTVGKGKLTWMMWTAYEAELLSPNGEHDADKPFALKLTYNMDFDSKDIAERSIKEIKGQGVGTEEQLQKWEDELKKIFPEVKEDDVIVGIKTADDSTNFLYNGEEIGTVEDPEFTKAFFDIWLSEKTSEPSLRKKLLAGE